MKHTAHCEAAIRRRPSGLLRDGRKVGVIFCKVDLPAYLHSEICQEPGFYRPYRDISGNRSMQMR